MYLSPHCWWSHLLLNFLRSELYFTHHLCSKIYNLYNVHIFFHLFNVMELITCAFDIRISWYRETSLIPLSSWNFHSHMRKKSGQRLLESVSRVTLYLYLSLVVFVFWVAMCEILYSLHVVHFCLWLWICIGKQ